MNEKIVLGILGGLGPMSSVYFYEMLTSHTKATCDQQHLNILLSSRADIPDRTAFITGNGTQNPLPAMQEEIRRLERGGVGIIAIPCNTAHYFYDGIAACTSLPILNIMEETARFAHRLGVSRVGVLATEGTVCSGAYRSMLSRYGIACVDCTAEEQRVISHIIYREIKQGSAADIDAFLRVADSLTAQGCERIILGCTELSLLKKQNHLGTRFIDALEVLAYRAITACGAEAQGFDPELMNDQITKG